MISDCTKIHTYSILHNTTEYTERDMNAVKKEKSRRLSTQDFYIVLYNSNPGMIVMFIVSRVVHYTSFQPMQQKN